MTGVKITVDDAEVISALRRLIAAGERPDPALKAIGEHMRQSTIDRIVAGKTPSGSPMKPLSPAYAKRKRGPGILRETGTLAQIVYQVADGELEVGTNAIYAAIHQFGGSITRHALSRKQSFRVADEGAYTRKDGSRVGSRLRFAQAGSPGSTEKWVTVGEHAIPIPARPFLGISEQDKVAIIEILSDFLGQAVGADGEASAKPPQSA